MAKSPAKRGKDQDLGQIAFDYIKSPHFRAIRADGAIGGITPEGFIHFAVYSERAAIPRQIVHKVEADGSLGPVKPELTVSRGTVVREMDADIFVTLDVAIRIRDWLDGKIKTLAQAKKKAAAESTPKPKTSSKPGTGKGRKRK